MYEIVNVQYTGTYNNGGTSIPAVLGEFRASSAADLPAQNVDCHIICGCDGLDIATGDRYIWNGAAWILQPSDRAFSNVYTKAEIDAMIANYYTKTESDALFEWITVTITTGTLPLSFISDGTPLTSVTIKGNGQQNGTPSPQNIVPFDGCGEWDADANSYKIPLTCAGQTVPVYLGEVSTTRRIMKLVLTGEENWILYGGNFFSKVVDATSMQYRLCACSHLESSYTSGIYIDSGASRLKVFSSSVSSVASNINEWKQYLAAQYAAGTPVTVWYVLANEQTGIVNEPLYRIGDYADTLTTDTPIPTAKGSNTLSVDTTVQPSEVSITGGIRNE